MIENCVNLILWIPIGKVGSGKTACIRGGHVAHIWIVIWGGWESLPHGMWNVGWGRYVVGTAAYPNLESGNVDLLYMLAYMITHLLPCYAMVLLSQ